LVVAEGGSPQWMALAVLRETVTHGSVSASGCNSPGRLGAASDGPTATLGRRRVPLLSIFKIASSGTLKTVNPGFSGEP
jgi:hypothetical protein